MDETALINKIIKKNKKKLKADSTKQFNILEERFNEFNLDPNLLWLAAIIRAKLRNDWDQCVCADGIEGVSKSTIIFWLNKLVDDSFSIDRSLTYDLDDFVGKIFKLPKYSAIWPDEGSDMFYKRDWAKDGRTDANQKLQMARQNNMFYGFCAPRLGDNDEYLRNWRVRIWINVIDRGAAAVYAFDRGVKQGDPWHLKKRTDRINNNFVMFITYPDMPDGDRQEYKNLKRKYFEKREKSDDGTVITPKIKKVLNAQMKANGFTQIERGKVLGISSRQVANYDKEYRDQGITTGQ
jgi:hypothetical protein